MKDMLKTQIMQKKQNANIKNDEIINGSLNQISQKFTLNERQDIAFKIAGSYLLDSFRKIFVKNKILENHCECTSRGKLVQENLELSKP